MKKQVSGWDKFFNIFGKISFFILILYIVFFLLGGNPTEEFDEGVFDSEGQIHKQLLNEEGYQVFYIGLYQGDAIVRMASLGDRQNQVLSGLSSLTIAYENASEYYVRIQEETRNCLYHFNGDTYRRLEKEKSLSLYLWELDVINNPRACG